MHINIGHWFSGLPHCPPRAQVLFHRVWVGIRWHRWPGEHSKILRGSLLLGFIELRLWRRPSSITAKVEYPQ